MSRIKYYLRYLANFLKFGFFDFIYNRNRYKYFTSLVNNFGIEFALKSKSDLIEKINLNNLLKSKSENNNIIIENWSFRQGNLTLYELYCLCSIVRKIKPLNILEIGTFDGLTTLHLALNSNPDTVIHTIDLPPNELKNVSFDLASGDKELVEKRGFETGICFKNHRFADKIIQHFTDSAKFDYSAWRKSFDMVFIDGSHSYNYVKTDSENALKIIGENGIIIWHDYGNVLDVTEYLNKLSYKLKISRIKETALVIHKSIP